MQMVKSRFARVFATFLLAGAILVAPAATEGNQAQAGPPCHTEYRLVNGGYSKAITCRHSQYMELINGKWHYAPKKAKGVVSSFSACYAGWQTSSYKAWS